MHKEVRTVVTAAKKISRRPIIDLFVEIMDGEHLDLLQLDIE